MKKERNNYSLTLSNVNGVEARDFANNIQRD